MYSNKFKILSYIKFFMTFAKVLNTAVTFEISFNSVSMLQKFKDSGGNKWNEWIFEMKSQIGKCTEL